AIQPAIAAAARRPRGASGRSASAVPDPAQDDFAWRRSISRIIGASPIGWCGPKKLRTRPRERARCRGPVCRPSGELADLVLAVVAEIVARVGRVAVERLVLQRALLVPGRRTDGGHAV